jgi:hypothetical protein
MVIHGAYVRFWPTLGTRHQQDGLLLLQQIPGKACGTHTHTHTHSHTVLAHHTSHSHITHHTHTLQKTHVNLVHWYYGPLQNYAVALQQAQAASLLAQSRKCVTKCARMHVCVLVVHVCVSVCRGGLSNE